jgi:hypothetical protein
MEAGDYVSEDFHFVVRGGRVRWDVQEGYAYRVYDSEAHIVSTVYPREKAVAQVPESALAKEAGPPLTWTFTTFDPHGKIAGLPCERVHAQAKGEPPIDVCVARDLPSVPLDLLAPSLAVAAPFASSLRARGLFPLASTAQSPEAPGGHARPGQGQGTRAPAAARTAGARVLTSLVQRRPVTEDEVSIPPSFPITKETTLRAPGHALR